MQAANAFFAFQLFSLFLFIENRPSSYLTTLYVLFRRLFCFGRLDVKT